MRNMKTVNYGGMFTLSAPSPKCVWDEQSRLVEVPAGQPAYGYDPLTGEFLGQRVEPPVTTYCTTDILNKATYNYGSTSEVSNFRFPGGGYYQFTCDTEGDPPGFQLGVNGRVMLGETDARYVIVNPGDFDKIRLTIYAFETSVSITFNFKTMEMEPESSGDRLDGLAFEHLGGDLYLIAITTPGNTSTYTRFGAQGSHVDGSPVQVGESFFAALPQVIKGARPRSFIYNPTSENMLREADLAAIENVDTAKWWNGDEGTVYLEGICYDQNTYYFGITPQSNRYLIIARYSGPDTVTFVSRNNGGTLFNRNFSGVPPLGTRFKQAVSWKKSEGTISMAFGGQVKTVTGVDFSTDSDRIAFGTAYYGSPVADCCVSDLKAKKHRATEIELQEMTAP